MNEIWENQNEPAGDSNCRNFEEVLEQKDLWIKINVTVKRLLF